MKNIIIGILLLTTIGLTTYSVSKTISNGTTYKVTVTFGPNPNPNAPPLPTAEAMQADILYGISLDPNAPPEPPTVTVTVK